MDTTQMQEQLLTQKEHLDELVESWASAKAEHDKHDEFKKIKLALTMEMFEGSEASKKTQALAHPEYQDYIENTKFEIDKAFYRLDAKKRGEEQYIDILRSLLSFNKLRIEHET